MPLPDVTITIQDGALGQVPASNANLQVKMGICAAGIVGVLYAFGDMITAQATLGQGPLLEAVALALGTPNSGGPVYAMPLTPSTAGTASAVTKTSPTGAAGTVAVTVAPKSTVRLKIILGGVNGTMTFQYSVGGGAFSATQASTGGAFAFLVPGTLTTATLAAAQTWVANDVYALNTDGTIVLTGTGPAATFVTQVSSPLDVYSPLITITTAGALGVAQFNYSLDNGVSTSGQILVPSGAIFVIPNTGLVLTFASTFGLADTFTFTTTTASFSNANVTTGLTTLLANAATWGWVHIVGMPTSSANSASLAAVVDAQMTVAQTAYRFVFGVVECPTAEGATTVNAAFASFASARTMVCAGTALVGSPLTGTQLHRSSAWPVTARLGAVAISEEPSFVGRGKLTYVVGLTAGIDWDENATPGLDSGRFCTLRSIPGLIGTYCTRGLMMAPPGSDYDRVSRRRVMDVACATTRAALLPYLNGTVRVDTTTGYIDERDAKVIETIATAKLKNAVVATGDASGCSVILSRTANILSTRTEPVTVRVIPLAILETFNVNIGFSNPVLTAALGLSA
jgi:hypothetical protein